MTTANVQPHVSKAGAVMALAFRSLRQITKCHCVYGKTHCIARFPCDTTALAHYLAVIVNLQISNSDHIIFVIYAYYFCLSCSYCLLLWRINMLIKSVSDTSVY